MSNWRTCIVTFIDVIGIKRLADDGTSRATDLMRKLHELTANRMNHSMDSHSHAYSWNDSVLLLGYLDSSSHSGLFYA